jgi:flagellar basal-body rod modification protein FlgD
MGSMAIVDDGKILNTKTNTESTEKKSDTSGMDKESFLQLLVAQMKYQDPLEPTSNTEYVSQYAQFSQVEQIQNMAESVSLQRASSLVGQEVYMNSTDASGNSTIVKGKVDYVVYQGGEAYLAIQEALYPLEDLNTVADKDYMEAYDLAMQWVTDLNKLPAVGRVDLSNANKITELKKTYDAMTDYQKSFVADEKKAALESYVAKIEELRKAQEEAENNAED